MEFLTILIIFAILSRIIEAVGGGKKQGPGTGPQQRPRRPLPQDRRQGLPPGAEAEPGARAPADVAAEMIPDDLWELLTGQKRQRPEPAPAPRAERLPAPVVDEEIEALLTVPDEEAAAAEYIRTHRRDVQGEIDATLAAQRRVLARRAPERTARAVSLETEPLPEPERHRRFHEKIDRPAPARPVVPGAAARLGLQGPAAVRRAFLLREVLGPPRALEGVDPDR